MAVLASIQDRVEVWNRSVKMPEVEEDDMGESKKNEKQLPTERKYMLVRMSKYEKSIQQDEPEPLPIKSIFQNLKKILHIS